MPRAQHKQSNPQFLTSIYRWCWCIHPRIFQIGWFRKLSAINCSPRSSARWGFPEVVPKNRTQIIGQWSSDHTDASRIRNYCRAWLSVFSGYLLSQVSCWMQPGHVADIITRMGLLSQVLLNTCQSIATLQIHTSPKGQTSKKWTNSSKQSVQRAIPSCLSIAKMASLWGRQKSSNGTKYIAVWRVAELCFHAGCFVLKLDSTQ